jgi:hypothetical protein
LSRKIAATSVRHRLRPVEIMPNFCFIPELMRIIPDVSGMSSNDWGVAMSGQQFGVREIQTLKAVLRLLSEEGRVTFAQMGPRIRAYQGSALKPKKDAQADAKEADIDWETGLFHSEKNISTTTINDFANDKRYSPRNKRVLNSIYLWAYSNYRNEWDKVAQKLFVKSEEEFVHSARRLFKKDAPKPNSIIQLSGIYRLYRPHYLDHEKELMICRLTIGHPNIQSYECCLEMKYRDPSGEVTEAPASGKIVPNEGRAFALMSVGYDGLYFLYFDQLERGGKDDRVRRLAGTMVASRDNRQSCAYPFFAERCDEEIQLGTISRNSRKIAAHVRKRLSFGAVHWR